MNFICINIEIVYNIPFGTLTDGNYGICILTCLPEFIRINETVNGWITLWIAQKNYIIDGYYASGVSCFPDIEWKLIAKTVINSDVIFLQATGDADGAPGRAALFP